MSEVIAVPEVGEFRHGWPVVLACFCTAVFAWGFGFYGQSVYFADLHATRGWSASLIASATTVYYLTGGVLLISVHRMIDLLGPRLLLASGAVVLGVGAIGLSRSQAPWELYAWGVVMAIGWAATTTTALATTLAYWFDRRRGLALSLALNGASAGGFTVTPVLALLVHSVGLERAVLLLVSGGLAILLPVILLGVGRVPVIDRAADVARPGAARRGWAAGAGDPGRGAAQPAVLEHCRAVRARVGGAGGLHRASVGIPDSASGDRRCRQCGGGNRVRRGGRAARDVAGDRSVEPADCLRRELRIAGVRAGTDAGAAGSAGGAICRQHRVRAVGGQRHHHAGADRATRVRGAVVWTGDRADLDGRVYAAGVRADAAGRGARCHRRLWRGAGAVHRAATDRGGDRGRSGRAEGGAPRPGYPHPNPPRKARERE